MKDNQKMSNIHIIIVSLKVHNSKRRLKKEKNITQVDVTEIR